MTEDGWVLLDQASDSRFRLQQAALLGYACATLPTRFSRRVVSASSGKVDPSAMPAEIWRKDDEAAFAFIWLVRHESSPPHSDPRRVVGFVRQVRGRGVEHVDLMPNDRVLRAFGNAEPVKFSDLFWRSDLTLPTPVEKHTPDESGDVGGTNRARQFVDDAFRKTILKDTTLSMTDLTLKPMLIDPSTSTWREQHDKEKRQYIAALLKKSGVCNFFLEAAASKRMVLLERETPFYEGCRLYRVIDSRGPRSLFASFILHERAEDIAPLNSHAQADDQLRSRDFITRALFVNSFKSRGFDKGERPIDNFHRRRISKGELNISESSVGAYLRFYCEFMHGHEEVFSFIETAEDICWLFQASPQQKKLVQQHLFMEQLMPVALYKPHFRVPVESFNTHPLLHQEAASGRWERTSTIYWRVCVSYGRNVFIAGVVVQPDGNFNNFAGRALYPSDLPIESVSCDAQFRFMLRTDGF